MITTASGSAARLVRAFEPVCRTVVRCAPPGFRRAWGDETVTTFRAACLAAGRRGVPGVMWTAIVEIASLAWIVVSLQLYMNVAPISPRPPRQNEPRRSMSMLRRLGRDVRTAIRNLRRESSQHRDRARDAGARHRGQHVDLQHPGLGDLAPRPVPRRGSAGRAGQLQRRAQVHLSRHVADAVGRLARADGPLRSRRSVRTSVVRLPQRQWRRDGVGRDRLARAVRDARRPCACGPMVRERRRPRRRRSTGGRERHVLAVDAAQRRWRRRATHHARRRRLRDRRRHAGDVPLSRRTHGSLAAV